MSQQMNQVNWNVTIGNASTSGVTTSFLPRVVSQWRMKNMGSAAIYYDFTGNIPSSASIAGPTVGTLESSGVLNGQGAVVQGLALWSTTTGAPGVQVIFNGFEV